MGALHEGHLALVRRAADENDFVTASIFVNPIQFNNPEDLAKYPRTIEADLKKLENEGCNMVFVPEVNEMYPEPSTKVYDFGMLDKVMEGKFRPGHFNGVAVVVKKLFDVMQPGKAYFGEKDYQQLQVIKALVRKENMEIEIVPCATVREADGLAMSSRNIRLTKEQRRAAPHIYKALLEIRGNVSHHSVVETSALAIKQIESEGVLKVEYLELADASTLLPVSDWSETSRIIACIAVIAGSVRLIDNLLIIS
jgi:pantoate--beta-alanine ligase